MKKTKQEGSENTKGKQSRAEKGKAMGTGQRAVDVVRFFTGRQDLKLI